MSETSLRCPQCQRWLADAAGYARLVCPSCGCELTWRAKEARRRAEPRELPRVVER